MAFTKAFDHRFSTPEVAAPTSIHSTSPRPAARTHNRSRCLGSAFAGACLGACSLRLAPHLGMKQRSSAVTRRHTCTASAHPDRLRFGCPPHGVTPSPPALPPLRFQVSRFQNSRFQNLRSPPSTSCFPSRASWHPQTVSGSLHDLAGKLQRFAHTGCETRLPVGASPLLFAHQPGGSNRFSHGRIEAKFEQPYRCTSRLPVGSAVTFGMVQPRQTCRRSEPAELAGAKIPLRNKGLSRGIGKRVRRIPRWHVVVCGTVCATCIAGSLNAWLWFSGPVGPFAAIVGIVRRRPTASSTSGKRQPCVIQDHPSVRRKTTLWRRN